MNHVHRTVDADRAAGSLDLADQRQEMTMTKLKLLQTLLRRGLRLRSVEEQYLARSADAQDLGVRQSALERARA